MVLESPSQGYGRRWRLLVGVVEADETYIGGIRQRRKRESMGGLRFSERFGAVWTARRRKYVLSLQATTALDYFLGR